MIFTLLRMISEEWKQNKEDNKRLNKMIRKYEMENKLKIRMPENHTVTDKLLTRQEAIDAYKRVWNDTQSYAEKAVDFWVALGMLKLKEEKKVEQSKGFIDGLPAEDWSIIKTAEFIVENNEFCSSKVVKRLLEIINRKEKKVGTAEYKNENLFTNKLDDDLVLIEAENVTRVHSFGEISADNIRRLINLVNKLLNIIKRGKP